MDDGCWQAGSKARKKYMLLRLPANSFLPFGACQGFPLNKATLCIRRPHFFPSKKRPFIGLSRMYVVGKVGRWERRKRPLTSLPLAQGIIILFSHSLLRDCTLPSNKMHCTALQKKSRYFYICLSLFII